VDPEKSWIEAILKKNRGTGKAILQGLPEWLRPSGTADPERPWIKAILANLEADKVYQNGFDLLGLWIQKSRGRSHSGKP